MTLTFVVLVVLGFALAFVNGANDVSKGIATLVGSGVTKYRVAMVWGVSWTAIGALLGAVFATAMVATFGNGLLAAGTSATLPAALGTLFGAGAWVALATRTGLPVSTTHAIVGSLVGSLALSHGIDTIRWSALIGKIALPLLLTPLVSLGVVWTLLRLRQKDRAGPMSSADCACAEVVAGDLVVSASADTRALELSAPRAHLRLVRAPKETCAIEHPHALRITLDHLHWLTSGATSLARGMNDAPKIVALLLSAAALGVGTGMSIGILFVLVTAGMVAGSIAAGLRVTRVLAEKVTPMDHHEGFIANLVTAALVTVGATLGLPMSTTHVASGGILGVGATRNSLDRRTLRVMALAWVITLPASALLGMSGSAFVEILV